MSLVIIMTIGGKYEHHDFSVVNLIHKTMLLGDPAAPLSSSVTRKWFGLSCTCTRMFLQLSFQLQELLKSFRFFVLQFLGILDSLLLVPDFIRHYPTRSIKSSRVSPSFNSYEGPFLASSIRWKNSSLVNSVGSFFLA